MSTTFSAHMNSFRVGVVGYGYWGSKHVRVLASLPGVDVTVIDSQPDRLREAMTAFPAVRVATSLSDVEKTLDAVVIASPRAATAPLRYKHYGQVCTPSSRSRSRRRSPSRRRYWRPPTRAEPR